MSVRNPMFLFTNAGVDTRVDIALHMPPLPEDRTVSILFGQEQIALEFYDVESLERLRDVADEGAQRLRAATGDRGERGAEGGSPVP